MAPRVRAGGRSARVVAQVLRATLEEVGRVGLGELRVEEVAARSGVNKTTIYRRWPDKATLVAAAIEHLGEPLPVASTGDLEHDFVDHFMRSLARIDQPHVRGLLRLVQAERHGPEIERVLRKYRQAHTAARRARLVAAVEAGELPRKTDVELVQIALTSTIYMRFLKHGELPTRTFVVDAVRLILAGARASPA